jgi:amino acid transporter
VKLRLLGRPLASSSLEETKLKWYWGLPILASDAVSSVAYAIEEILLVLVPLLGAAAVGYVPWVAAPIILLLLVLAFSYAQIIKHYPAGGGAYNVASDNFGKKAAMVAASSLVIDYVLTVAVSISSATAAFTSAFPQFARFRVFIAVLCVLLTTLMNLRGSQESSKIFGVPTYAFIVIMAVMIIVGLIRLTMGSLQPIALSTYYATPQSTDYLTQVGFLTGAFLMLRAFSSGCSALTGIEAVSNSMPSFAKPRQKNAQKVLYCLAAIVLFIFGGSIVLARSLHVMPYMNEIGGALVPAEGSMTVVAQMGRAVFGAGSPLFYILQFATALILLLAANTAYTDLPNLLSILARDGFMPRQFMQRGTKLTLSNGILFLAVAAVGLIVIFSASVHHLIPLYSVGVFLSFTISQSGMVKKWIRDKEKHWQTGMLINVLGTIMTFVGLIIVFVMKFTHGAWILAIAIPCLSYLMARIHRHYVYVRRKISISKEEFLAHYHPSLSKNDFLCIVLVDGVTRPVLKLLNYANRMSQNVIAVHVSLDSKRTERFRKKWDDYASSCGIPLQILESSYRDLIGPLEDYLDLREERLTHGDSIAVVLTKFVLDHPYETMLHNQTTYQISRALRTYKNVSTVLVPYHYRLPNEPSEAEVTADVDDNEPLDDDAMDSPEEFDEPRTDEAILETAAGVAPTESAD